MYWTVNNKHEKIYSNEKQPIQSETHNRTDTECTVAQASE